LNRLCRVGSDQLFLHRLDGHEFNPRDPLRWRGISV
jgi:hypothetical protein